MFEAAILVAALQGTMAPVPCDRFLAGGEEQARPDASPPATDPTERRLESGPTGETRARVSASPMTVDDVMHARHEFDGPARRGLGRWFDVSTAAVAVRYRMLESKQDAAAVRQVQDSLVFRGRLKLDPRARYSVHAGAATGRGFDGGWNDTGLGAGTPVHDVFVKELFVVARPADGVSVEIGGLYIVRGESTESTSYDNDGYLVGERLTLQRSGIPLVDAVSVTRAHLGDLRRASVFDRLRHLDRANYYQALAVKRLNRHAAVSTDYTWQAGIHIVRGAVNLDVRGFAVADAVRFENYARVAPFPGYGYAVTLQRDLGPRLMAGAGFSNIDDRYGALSGDLGRPGRRAHGSMAVRLGTVWLASVQLARTLGHDRTIGARTRLDVALGYDVRRAFSGAPDSR